MAHSSEGLTEKSTTEPSTDGGNASIEKPKEDEQLTPSQKLVKLKRDLNTMVTNILAAAEAREVQWRTDIDKDSKMRLELVEDHVLSSNNKIEEISKGWVKAKEMVILQEVQEMLILQQRLCAELIADKEKVNDVIQQDLKARDDSFVTDLKKQTEELQLMLERMMEQDNTLTKTYREQLAQWKEAVQKEEETKCSEEKSTWENCMKKLLDTEVEKLLKRQEKVEDYNAKIYEMIFEEHEKVEIIRNELYADFQRVELEVHQAKSERIFMDLKIEKQNADSIKLKAEDSQLKAKRSSFETELKKMWMNETTDKKRKEKQLREKLLKELNLKTQDYERLQKKIMHCTLVDTIMFENMWLTLDAEVKELMERALYIDSMITKEVLHLSWEPPNLSFVDIRREERCGIFQTSHVTQESAVAAQTDAENRDVAGEGFYSKSESESEAGSTAEDRDSVMPRTVKRMMELLCDEAGFLLEVKQVKVLDTLDENERIIVKMGYLFNTLGIEEKDVPKLVDFLYRYSQQYPKESEDTVKAGPSHSTSEGESSSKAFAASDLVDPNEVLHALKYFLAWYKEGSKTDQWSVQSVEAHDMSKEEAYWESMGNVITPEKLKMWEVTEEKLKSHHAVLSEISELNLEIQSLQQENTELQMVCMLLQQVCMDQPLSFSPDVTQMDLE